MEKKSGSIIAKVSIIITKKSRTVIAQVVDDDGNYIRLKCGGDQRQAQRIEGNEHAGIFRASRATARKRPKFSPRV